MELTDGVAAETHGAAVAREIIRNNRAQTQAWRLQVYAGDRDPCFELLFASVDDSIHHLLLKVQGLVRQAGSATASLMDTIQAVQVSCCGPRRRSPARGNGPTWPRQTAFESSSELSGSA